MREGTADARPDDPPDGPDDLATFAADLRALRVTAGAPSYAALARRTGVPRSTLHDALGGERFPSLETVVALAEGLGADPATWRDRWTAVRLASEHPADTDPTDTAPTDTAPTDTAPTDSAPTDTAPTDSAPTDTAPPPRRRRPRRRWLVAAAVVVLAGAGALTWALTRDDCVPGERYTISAAGDLLDARGGVLERLDPGETVVVTDKHPPEYRSRYRAVSDDSGTTGYVDESKIDPVGDAC